MRKSTQDEEPYKNREIREMVKDVRESLTRIEIQTALTNGKVRKIIIALVAVAAYTLGTTHDIISLLKLFAPF